MSLGLIDEAIRQAFGRHVVPAIAAVRDVPIPNAPPAPGPTAAVRDVPILPPAMGQATVRDVPNPDAQAANAIVAVRDVPNVAPPQKYYVYGNPFKKLSFKVND